MCARVFVVFIVELVPLFFFWIRTTTTTKNSNKNNNTITAVTISLLPSIVAGISSVVYFVWLVVYIPFTSTCPIMSVITNCVWKKKLSHTHTHTATTTENEKWWSEIFVACLVEKIGQHYRNSKSISRWSVAKCVCVWVCVFCLICLVTGKNMMAPQNKRST